METHNLISRRAVVKSSVFGLMTVSMPGLLFAKHVAAVSVHPTKADLFYRYPSIDDEIVSEVVGASHFNLDRVKELVNKRTELARAAWDWGFGDWETAIGAASHVGRRDIVAFLLSKGARPDIFTYAMLGSHASVKAMIESTPGIQSTFGPHGISLLQHAKNGLQFDNLSAQQKETGEKLVRYLESLGNADIKEKNLDMTDQEKEKYVGDYKYGENPNEGFTIRLNMRKLLSLGKIGKFGGGLYRKANNVFTYNGITSVEISFQSVGDKIISLTVHEPDLSVTAIKI